MLWRSITAATLFVLSITFFLVIFNLFVGVTIGRPPCKELFQCAPANAHGDEYNHREYERRSIRIPMYTNSGECGRRRRRTTDGRPYGGCRTRRETRAVMNAGGDECGRPMVAPTFFQGRAIPKSGRPLQRRCGRQNFP